jgi:hypothetical protein
MSYESPTIRPPSEWRSGLLRVTRGCNWNRCLFCGIYSHLGEPDYSVRTLPKILSDLDTLQAKRPDIETLFIGDADPLNAGMDLTLHVLNAIREKFNLTRITSYARFSTLYKLGSANIHKLAQAGLSRIHLGLESGDDDILKFQRKGQNRKIVHTASAWLKEAGIEMSVYVLLGIGGTSHWRNHAINTAQLLNEIEPEFIRIRRLHIYSSSLYGGPPCPLTKEITQGRFTEQSPEGTVLELQLLLSNMKPIHSFFTCDHSNNYLNISGQLTTDLEEMLAAITAFLTLPPEKRNLHYASIGSGI